MSPAVRSAKIPTDGSSSNRPDSRRGRRRRCDRRTRRPHRPRSSLLLQSLEESRRLGFLGSRPIAEVVAHARHFVERSSPPPVRPATSLRRCWISAPGGGVPGLVIAHDLPGRHASPCSTAGGPRTDFLARVVRRLEWTDRVDVLTQDADQTRTAQRASFDAVVARGFGPPRDDVAHRRTVGASGWPDRDQ